MTTGDKIKKSVIYILLVLLAAGVPVPVSSDDGQRDQGRCGDYTFLYADTEHASERKLGDRI